MVLGMDELCHDQQNKRYFTQANIKRLTSHCHSERSEESLNFALSRCFVSLSMT